MFCFHCGYDLAGLALPHNCPECGTPADPANDAEHARHWFNRPGLFRSTFNPKFKPPLGFHYLLDDESCRQTAARKRFRWITLPMIAIFLVTLVGSSIDITYNAHETYSLPASPDGPICEFDYDLNGRALERNPKGEAPQDFYRRSKECLTVSRNSGAVNGSQVKTVKRIAIKLPAMLWPFAPFWMIPFAALIIAYPVGRRLLIAFVRSTANVPDPHAAARSIANLEIRSMFLIGIAAWMWTTALVITILTQIGWLPDILGGLAEGLLAGAIFIAIGNALTVYPNIIFSDPARRLMCHPILYPLAIILTQAAIITAVTFNVLYYFT